MTDRIRVLIVEDQAMIRRAMARLLSLEDDIEVVGEAADGIEALQQVRAWRPQVILMDIEMPRLDGIEATRKILGEHPACRIIMLTTFDDEELVFRAIQAGAAGYLLKDASEPEIVETIRGALRNESSLSPAIARKVLEEMRRLLPAPTESAPKSEFKSLSARENEILDKIVAGLSNKQIAAELSLAEGTVKNYVSRILEKVHARSRTELAIMAMKRNK